MMKNQQNARHDAHDTLMCHSMHTLFFIQLPLHAMKQYKDVLLQQLQFVDQEWSRFHESNELACINQQMIGQTRTISPLLYACLQQAHTYYVQTAGAFSPYLKQAMCTHGYNQTFPFTKATVTQQTLPIQQTPFIFLPSYRLQRVGIGEIDLGGFAKGFIIERLAMYLQQNGVTEGMIDGGGDIRVWSSGQKTWKLAVANPYDQHKPPLTTITLQNGAVATSNRIYRSWHQGDVVKHHLLDGRTGEVCQSDIIQATVVTAHLTDAEVATKLCFLQQPLPFTTKVATYIVKAKQQAQWQLKGAQL